MNSKLAVSVWTDRAIYRKTLLETFAKNAKYLPVLVCMVDASMDSLNFWKARFVTVVRRKNGQIIAGIQRYLRADGYHPATNIFKKDDLTFDILRKALDFRLKELTNKDIGTKK